MRNLSFYRAAIINPIDDHRASFWPDGVLVTQRSADGISRVLEILDYHHACEKYVEDFGTSNLYEFPQAVILPAFFDMHFHWVQDDVRLMPKDSLLEWLEKYTFPAESKFSSKSYAQRKAKIFFKRLAAMGTLGGACYSSIHPHALDAAMKEAKGHLLIGNVMMTMNSPKALSQTSQEAVRVSVQAMKRYQHRYVLTPRFAISTDPQTMRVTSQEANRRQIFKQSHLSENPDEIKFVLELYRGMKGFKKVKSYTEIYYKVGMLGKRSLMGHAIHLSRSELALLSRTQTALIHCPTSNAPLRQQGLGSGLFNFSQVEKA
jgi:guanine deaminase